MSEDTAERDETVWGEGGDTQAESGERRPGAKQGGARQAALFSEWRARRGPTCKPTVYKIHFPFI